MSEKHEKAARELSMVLALASKQRNASKTDQETDVRADWEKAMTDEGFYLEGLISYSLTFSHGPSGSYLPEDAGEKVHLLNDVEKHKKELGELFLATWAHAEYQALYSYVTNQTAKRNPYNPVKRVLEDGFFPNLTEKECELKFGKDWKSKVAYSPCPELQHALRKELLRYHLDYLEAHRIPTESLDNAAANEWRPPRYADEMSLPDALLGNRLKSIGEHGAKLANDLAKRARERVNSAPYKVWFDPTVRGLCRYPWLLAEALWIDQVKPLLDAGPPRPAMVKGKDSGDEYWKVDKTLGAISWAVAGMGNIDVDGDQYAATPAATRYLPRAHAVLPRGRRPSQQILGAALYDEPGGVSLISRTLGDTQALLGEDASKLSLLFMATGAKFTKLTLGELVKTVTPNGRRIQKRDIERVARALRDVRGLGLVLPDDTDIQLFDVRAPRSPERADKGQTIAWSYSNNFADVLSGGRCTDSKTLNALRGEFLINFTAFMNFNGNQGLLMRHYLAACTVFNDSMGFGARAGYDPSAAPTFTREEWAAQTNSLSQAAVDLLTEGTTRARSASKARDLKKSDEALDALEAAGLIILEGPANARRIIAPDEWQEAHRLFRSGGARPDPDK
jgi:hypothetical protein